MTSISTFFGLNIALKGLQAQQAALNVTAHNVANQNTDGYTRQRADLVAALGIDISSGALANGHGAVLGGGTDVQSYVRARDAFTDLQWRAQSTTTGYADTMDETLSSAEVTLQEPGENGIASKLNDFWSSWQKLANNPEDPSVRNALVISGQALTDAIKALDQNISDVSSSATAEYTQLIGPNGDVQTLATQIASLNAQISKETIAGRQPNDLLDARDKAIDQLSALGQVSVADNPNGSIAVTFGDDATPIVDDQATDFTGLAGMTAPGGKLGALLDVSSPGGALATYRAALDTVAMNLKNTVNGAYGGTFFDAATTGAANLAIDPGLVAAPGGITANSDGTAGNNDIALAVAGLKSGTADKAYSDFVLQFGADVHQADQTDDTAQAVLTSITDKRDSISGVSLDEEVTNMLQYQRGYQASSRMMSTIDSMLDTLINRTGSVGL